MIRIYGDLSNPDARGRVVLRHAEDFNGEEVELREGLKVLVWDDALEAEGTLEYYEGHWRARIEWQTLTDRETGKRLPKKYWK